jgi:hypothetical protein
LKEPTDVLGRMRVASPCGVSWDSMDGDGRVRFCRLCSLNVYDFAGMTRAEVEALVTKTEGRLCGRMTRRADGTVLTKDCPVGLRALRLRATRAAGAAFAALLSLCSLAFGQEKTQKLSCERGGGVKVERKEAKDKTAKAETASLSGSVLDPSDAFIPGAEVVLTDEATKREFKATASDSGEFSLANLPAGKYTLRVSSPGFMTLAIESFEVAAGEELTLTASLALGETLTGIVNVIPYVEPDIETKGGKTTFRGRALTDLPLGPPEEK